ncbi:peptide synthetase, putative [Babesia ovata]|uniref:Peptide synthetase, putative n=1 Tax=Babesia ovata TaxID=189622 RepID=A0A2H6K9C2_9APIC|nr:peptide synthetase, putative [Babesia ovata]GBE59583.1 peptide synthetase, putative [Babesia ovata]
MTDVGTPFHILRKTRFTQCRTAYNTIRNALLGLQNRPVYVTEAFELHRRKRHLIAIKKALSSRRNSKKGPFHRLLPPHPYSNLFGDPTYYSNNELCRTCVMASTMRLADRTFWWQISEKIRKVRDVMNIGDLLRCLVSLSTVRYFDVDLLRITAREFVDDMDKLTLKEIAQLLQCYVRANVYSVDLVNAAGDDVAGRLMKMVSGDIQADGPRDGHISNKGEDDSKWAQETLGLLAKSFRSFNYQNRDLYLSIAYLTIKNWGHLDLYGKCATFANLDHRNFRSQPNNESNAVSAESGEEISRETTLALLRQLTHFPDGFHLKRLDSITDDVDFDDMVPSAPESIQEDYVKALHALCCAVSAVNNLAKVICRIVDNAAFVRDSVEAENVETIIDSMMEKMAAISAKLKHFWRELEAAYNTMERKQVAFATEDYTDISQNGGIKTCPYINAAQHVFIDAAMKSVCAVNAAIRFKVNAVGAEGRSVSSSEFCFAVEDANVHSELYHYVDTIDLSPSEMAVVGHWMDTIETYGCSSQEPELLACALETLGVMPCVDSQKLPLSMARLQGVHDIVALEAVKHLVNIGEDGRYRILLALRLGKITPNAYLEHALQSFTKYLRKNKCNVKLPLASPFRLLLEERMVPVSRLTQQTESETNVGA